MKVTLWTFGKENKSHREEAMGLYTRRLNHYCDFEMKILSAGRNKKKGKGQPQGLKAQEAEVVNRMLTPDHILFCLDETGKSLSSVGLSQLLDMYVALPILSTYLGHKTIMATERYLRLTASMYPCIEKKFSKPLNKILGEG